MTQKEIDQYLSRLKRITNYAKDKGVSRQHIWQEKKRGNLEIVEIDGTLFVDTGGQINGN